MSAKINCPFYEKCPEKLGDDDTLGIKCREEGFIPMDDGVLCLAWDIVLAKEIFEDVS